MAKNVSVIIPVFNGEKTISISLDSLLKQTCNNFEVIIVDDGSYDRTSEVVKKYINSNIEIKYIYQQNLGVSAARNRGVENATGEYVCFLDSDDYYDSTFIDKMYKRITEVNADVCYCGYKVITPNKIIVKKMRFKQGHILDDYILGKLSIHTTGWIIKKELLIQNSIIFPNGISWGEDFEFFCLVLALVNNVICVNEYLSNYRYDFETERLSKFNMDKIDKDYEAVCRLINDRRINNNYIISKALINYRLSALITYRCIEAFNLGIEKEIIYNYFNQYKKYIMKFTWNNGLRSLKLNLYKLLLLYKIMIIKRS